MTNAEMIKYLFVLFICAATILMIARKRDDNDHTKPSGT